MNIDMNMNQETTWSYQYTRHKTLTVNNCSRAKLSARPFSDELVVEKKTRILPSPPSDSKYGISYVGICGCYVMLKW